MTTRQKIDRSREVRLWIGQVIVPTAAAVGMVMSNSEARNWTKAKLWLAKEKVKSIFTKKES